MGTTVEQMKPSTSFRLLKVLGFDSSKRNNLHLVDDETLIIAVGTALVFLDIQTLQQKFLTCPHGIGAVAVHPSRECFAVAEKSSGGTTPNL
jgi:hypothetical protein